MAASPSQIAGSMGAGTTEYGQRGQLAADIQGAVGSAAPTPGMGASMGAASGAAGVGGPMDPLGAMLGGTIGAGSGPLTSGLSVGPGPGPASPSGADMDMQARLLAVAQNAKSPQLRKQARIALQRIVKSRRVV